MNGGGVTLAYQFQNKLDCRKFTTFFFCRYKNIHKI